MPVTIDELFEAAASGVLRALEARKAGSPNMTDISDLSVAGLVRSGFSVGINITAGGPWWPWSPRAPQSGGLLGPSQESAS